MNEKLEQLEKTAKELLAEIEKFKNPMACNYIVNQSELDILKDKYKSGDYICILTGYDINGWVTTTAPQWYCDHKDDKYKLIHKKHKDILDAYLKDKNIDIEYFTNYYDDNNVWSTCVNFIDLYKESEDYRLKPKEEYPIFKTNENNVIMIESKTNFICMLSSSDGWRIGKHYDYNITAKDELSSYNTIPYNKERGLYHKQPVWGIKGNSTPRIYFYNYNSDSLELITDFIYCDEFTEIIPITPDQLKTMPFIWEMYKKLED